MRITPGSARHWRDNGELRGAIRSAAQALGAGLGTVHVISADFEAPFDFELEAEEGEDEWDLPDNSTEEWRVGQIPSWLDWRPDGRSRIQWHFHSSVFRLPRDDDGSLHPSLGSGEWSDEAAWREMSLPSFNSFGIETRIGMMEGLAEHLCDLSTSPHLDSS